MVPREGGTADSGYGPLYTIAVLYLYYRRTQETPTPRAKGTGGHTGGPRETPEGPEGTRGMKDAPGGPGG
jgi:hypothetical protein